MPHYLNNAILSCYVYMRGLSLMVLLFCPLISSATTTTPAPCEIPRDELPLAPEVRIDEMMTSCSDKECDVSFKMDKQVASFQFKSLWIERKGKPMFAGELATSNSGSFKTAWFGADHSFFHKLTIYASYTNGDNCNLVSKMEVTHNKKRNILDATIVAPIR